MIYIEFAGTCPTTSKFSSCKAVEPVNLPLFHSILRFVYAVWSMSFYDMKHVFDKKRNKKILIFHWELPQFVKELWKRKKKSSGLFSRRSSIRIECFSRESVVISDSRPRVFYSSNLKSNSFYSFITWKKSHKKLIHIRWIKHFEILDLFFLWF